MTPPTHEQALADNGKEEYEESLQSDIIFNSLSLLQPVRCCHLLSSDHNNLLKTLYIVRLLYINDPTKIQRKPQQSGEKQEERTGGQTSATIGLG